MKRQVGKEMPRVEKEKPKAKKETKATKTDLRSSSENYGPIDGLRKRENRLLRKINAKGGDILFFVDAAMTVVQEYEFNEPKQDGSGRRYFPIRPRVVARLVQQDYNLSYRELELLLEQNKLIRDKMGIDEAPDHNTLQRTCSLIKEKDLQKIREGIGAYKVFLERQLKLY